MGPFGFIGLQDKLLETWTCSRKGIMTMSKQQETAKPNSISQRDEPLVRRLTDDEIAELRRDMAESAAWMRAELKRRREAKDKADQPQEAQD